MMYNINNKARTEIESLPNLEFAALALGTEGLGDVFKRISNSFIDKLKNVSSFYTTKKGDIKDINITAKELNKLKKNVNNIIKNYSYSGISTIEVGFVIGLNENLYDAVNHLKIAIDNINDNLIQELDNVDTLISKILVDEEYRKMLKPNIPNSNMAYYNISDSLDKIINRDNTKDLYTIGELLPNVNSLDYIYTKLIDINHTINDSDIKIIKDLIDKISIKSDALITQLHNKDIEFMSKEVVSNLADKLINTAKLTTLSVSVYHLLNLFNTHTVRMIEIIEKLGKKK